jgi:hypothetical protein
MKERQDRILEMIREKVIRQVGLHERSVTTSIVPIPNPHNNNLDDLEDTDDAEGCLPIYNKPLSARTPKIQSQSLAKQEDNNIGHQSGVR